MSTVKNIVFDLGGVIINLDILATIKAFQELGAKNFPALYTQLKQHRLFDDFDKGFISEQTFHTTLNELTQLSLNFSEFESAWNAMLLDFPAHRLQHLKKYQPHYRLFLLSNTNETHIRAFEKILLQTHGYANLDSFFERVYYSCRMGMRKPDSEIFEHVLYTHQLQANETLFIDDSPQHVLGASRCGIKAHLLVPTQDVFDALNLILPLV